MPINQFMDVPRHPNQKHPRLASRLNLDSNTNRASELTYQNRELFARRIYVTFNTTLGDSIESVDDGKRIPSLSTYDDSFYKSQILNFDEPVSIEPELLNIFAAGLKENSDEEEESEFSKRLTAFIDHYQTDAIDTIERAITSRHFDPIIVSEALSIVGASEEKASFEKRLKLLCDALESPISKIRYGAAIGLASLNTSKAVPALEQAFARERGRVLQDLFRQLIQHIEQKSE